MFDVKIFDHALLKPVLAQQENEIFGNIWRNVGADPTVIMFVLGTLIAIVLAIVIGAYKYQKWKKFKQFEDEMKALELDAESEGTFAWMVRRYAMDQPVDILVSPRLFDEMAASEIQNVLASNASVQSKSRFIDIVYDIRNKTYSPDLKNAKENLKQPGSSAEEKKTQEETASQFSTQAA